VQNLFIYCGYHSITDLLRVVKSNFVKVKQKGKGKAIPLQAWTGTEASSRLRIQDFKTPST